MLTPVGAFVLVEMTAACTELVVFTVVPAGSAPNATFAPPETKEESGNQATLFSIELPLDVLFSTNKQA